MELECPEEKFQCYMHFEIFLFIFFSVIAIFIFSCRLICWISEKLSHTNIENKPAISGIHDPPVWSDPVISVRSGKFTIQIATNDTQRKTESTNN